jgi:ABC-type lipoprotein release transport system permease subunit
VARRAGKTEANNAAPARTTEPNMQEVTSAGTPMDHEVQPTDPWTTILATNLVVIVSHGASAFPARRAPGIEPTEALRHS